MQFDIFGIILFIGLGALVISWIVPVLIRREMRERIIIRFGAAYPCVIMVVAIILSLEAAAITAITMFYSAVPSQVMSSSLVFNDFILVYFQYFLVSILLALTGWHFLASARRHKCAMTNSCLITDLRRGWWLVDWKAFIPTMGLLICVSLLSWYVPIAVWLAQGRPPIEYDYDIYNYFTVLANGRWNKSIGIINGKPIKPRGEKLEGGTAVGDVNISIKPSVAKKYTHTFRKMKGKQYGYWEAPLTDNFVMHIKANTLSGMFKGSYLVSATHNGDIAVIIEFFGNEPRVLMYNCRTRSMPKLLRRSE